MNRFARIAFGLVLVAAAGLAIPACGGKSKSEPAPVNEPGSLQFSAATFSGAEGASATITVSRAGGSSGAVAVHYATSSGTATLSADYTAASGTLNWTSGDAASKSFTVTLANDALVEGDETVNIALSLPVGATLGTQDTAVLTIIDGDAPVAGVLQFSSAAYSVNEGAGTATITVTRTGGSNGAAGVNYATNNGSATAGSDYTAVMTSLSWADGETADKTFAVAITDDGTAEPSETINLTLSSASGAALGTTYTSVLTIVDNDSSGALQFNAATYETTESGGTATIEVARTGGSMGAVGVTYATVAAGSTATAVSDYTAVTNTLSWADGDMATKSFTVTVINDTTVENDETVNLALSSPTGGADLGTQNTAMLWIIEDDVALQFSAADYNVLEVEGIATVTVTRIGSSFGAVGVHYATSDGTATQPADYAADSGDLNWPDGDTSAKMFNVTSVDDGLAEGDETVNLTLTAPTGGATLGARSAATLTIIDNGDTIPPVVSFTAPADLDTGVATNSNITATFSEVMQSATIGAVTFTISPVVAGTVTYDAPSRTAKFDPTAALAATTIYTMTITTGVRDAAGNAMAANKVWSFTTGAAADSTPPTVSLLPGDVTPANGSTDVSLDTHQVITFSEPMDAASVAAATTTGPVLGFPLQFFWNAAGTKVTIVFDTDASLGITGDDILTEDTTYTVTVGTGAKDLAGNALASAYSTSFTTRVDGTLPLVTSITPDMSALVSTSTSSITVRFNEDMDVTRARVELQVGIGMGDGPSGSIGGPPGDLLGVTWDANKRDLHIAFQNGFALTAGTSYQLRIEDLSDPAFNYLSGGVRRNMVTAGSVSDSTAPIVTCEFPAHGATAVHRDMGIVVAFSEAMAPDILDHITVSDPGSTSVEKENEGFIVVINPLKAWPANSTVTVTIDSGAMDTNNNAVAGTGLPTTFSFTTGAGDSNPMVLDPDYCTIVDGWTDCSTSSYYRWNLKFKNSVTDADAYLNLDSLKAADVSVTEKDTGIPLKGYTLGVGEDGDSSQLRIEHMSNVGWDPLKFSTTYVITLKGTLKNAEDVPISPATIEFTTHEWEGQGRPYVAWGLESAYMTFPLGQTVELRAGVQDDNGTPGGVAVTAQDSPDVAFSQALSWSGNEFQYRTEDGTYEANIFTAGAHVMTYTISDEFAAHTSTVKAKGWVFGSLPTDASPVGAVSSTPTFTWDAPVGSEVAAYILIIQDASWNEVYDVILNGTRTSFAVPADRALTSGDYNWYLIPLHFNDDAMRVGGRPGMGLVGPNAITVP